MKTTSKEKIEKAKRLLELVLQRRAMEKEESELKAFFKIEAADGFLEAGDILIVIQRQVRTNLDRDALKKALGAKYAKFELPTEVVIVDVRRKGDVA